MIVEPFDILGYLGGFKLFIAIFIYCFWIAIVYGAVLYTEWGLKHFKIDVTDEEIKKMTSYPLRM